MSRFSGMGKESQVDRAKRTAKDEKVNDMFKIFLEDVYPDTLIFTVNEMRHAFRNGWYSYHKEGE